jgi:hypothetical protein
MSHPFKIPTILVAKSGSVENLENQKKEACTEPLATVVAEFVLSAREDNETRIVKPDATIDNFTAKDSDFMGASYLAFYA